MTLKSKNGGKVLAEFTVEGPSSGINADCSVRVINGEVYIAAMCWKTGLSVFKLN